MSVRVSSWVWENPAIDASELPLMLALADMADDDGRNAWPSVATLMRKTRKGRKTVQRLIGQLADKGLLAIEEQTGPHRVNRYTLLLPAEWAVRPALRARKGVKMTPSEGAEGRQDDTPAQNDTVSFATAEGCHLGPERGSEMTPDPSLTVLDPSKVKKERTRAINPVLKPKDAEAAELAACPLWAALIERHGGPPPAALDATWRAARRDLLDRTKEPPGLLAAGLGLRWAVASATWSEAGMVTVPAVLNRWEDLGREAARSARRAQRLADGGLMPSEVGTPREVDITHHPDPPVPPDRGRDLLAKIAAHGAARAARLARLGTDEEAQAWWHRAALEEPRLPPSFRAATFVPPQGDGAPAALIFEGKAGAERASLMLGGATRRIRAKYPGASLVACLVESEVVAALGEGEGDGGPGATAVGRGAGGAGGEPASAGELPQRGGDRDVPGRGGPAADADPAGRDDRRSGGVAGGAAPPAGGE